MLHKILLPYGPLNFKHFLNISVYPFTIIQRRTDAEAPILWPPDVKSQLNGKNLDAGKDWGQEVKGETEDKMVGLHHWLNELEFEQTPGNSEGQGSLAFFSFFFFLWSPLS